MRTTAIMLLAAAMVSATPNIHPHPTMDLLNAFTLDGWSPAPTQGPSEEVLEKRLNQLQARQATLSSGQLIGYFAQDSLCGYISGSIGASLPCSSSSRCAAIAPIGGSQGAVGCCPLGGSGCYFITTCYNLADIQSSKCDQGCQQDADVRICSASASPYCFGYSWSDISATIWGCAASSVSTKAPVSLNFNGATSTKTWSAAYYTPSGASSNQLASAVSSLRSASSAASSGSSSPSPSASSGNSTNVGAIVGGVIGGLALLGLIAFGVIFFLLKKRKNKTDPNATTTAVGAPPTGVYPPQGDQAPYGNDPQMGYAGAGAASAASAGYYNHEHKQPISELATPESSPGAGYLQPAKMDPNGTPYHDNRVSAYSESGSPVPAYQQPYNNTMQPVMELHGETAPHANAQGQQVFEAPDGTPAAKP